MRKRRSKVSEVVESEIIDSHSPDRPKIHFADRFHHSRLQFSAVLLIKSGCLLFGIGAHGPRTMSGSTKSLDVLLLNLITDGGEPGAIPICVFKTLFSAIQAAFLIFIMIRLRALNPEIMETVSKTFETRKRFLNN